MAVSNKVRSKHKSSTLRHHARKRRAQDKSGPQVTGPASSCSGGHGNRTRNRLPGITFPV